MTNQPQPPQDAPWPAAPALPSPSPEDYYFDMEEGRGLKDYAQILRRRKWWVIGTFLTVFLAATLYTFLRTPIFRATATLQITQDNPGSQVSVDDKVSSMFGGGDSLEKFQQTQYSILQNESLAQRLIDKLHLADHPDFISIREDNPDKSDYDLENDLIEAYLKKLDITPVRNSFLVQVSFQSPDKSLAQQVVNTLADEYMYLSIDRRNESFKLVRNWLDRQLQDMAGKLQETQKKLYKFGQQTDIYTLEDKDNVIVQKYIDLSSLLTKAQAEKLDKEAQFKQIEAKGPNAPLIVNHPLVAELRKQLVVQQAKVSALKKIYRGEHPEMLAEQANLAELQGRLQAEVQRLQESIRADYEAATRTEKLLSDSFTDQKGEMTKLQDNLVDYQILKRDAQTTEQLYLAVLARVKEASIASSMVPANVVLINPARQPSKPYKPKPLRDLAIAALLGLTLGVGLAFLREHLDDSIQSTEDVERYCNLPSLGMIPLLGGNGHQPVRRLSRLWPPGLLNYLPGGRRHAPVFVAAQDRDQLVVKDPRSPASEAIRHAHTALMLSASGKPPEVIMVTSAAPSEGKSTMASNLALTFALDGHSTLLIDADLRKPRQHQVFQLQLQPGLSNYLTGAAALEEIIRPTPVSHYAMITAGALPPNPANLLNSPEFKELLTQLRPRFDHIIIDTPPLLGFSDGLLIAVQTDGVLLVTRHNATHKSAARLAQQLLNRVHAPLLGALLNGVDAQGQAYGGYHYGYYAHYYGEKEK